MSTKNYWDMTKQEKEQMLAVVTKEEIAKCHAAGRPTVHGDDKGVFLMHPDGSKVYTKLYAPSPKLESLAPSHLPSESIHGGYKSAYLVCTNGRREAILSVATKAEISKHSVASYSTIANDNTGVFLMCQDGSKVYIKLYKAKHRLGARRLAHRPSLLCYKEFNKVNTQSMARWQRWSANKTE